MISCMSVTDRDQDRFRSTAPRHAPLVAGPGYQRRWPSQEYRRCADMGPGFGPILPRMSGRIGADVVLLPVRRCAVLVVRLQCLTMSMRSSPKTARHSFSRLRHAPAHPRSSGRLRGGNTKQGAVRFAHSMRRRSRSASSASSRAMVIRPLSWPVSTFCSVGVGLSARKSKAKPCAGSSIRSPTATVASRV